ncbi:transcriptional regulator [Saccharibacter sp. 17.LH.SD]|uniref:RrF2 family transcriptional regulator n=1 Tax=Saccharibacter sp. 17.LH.SD TaxID=2689393 RepID=UPI0013721EF5|nr:Rrf2 family transcriptional regulator [Saccharibacter sp. 17.LH.SD]MXV45095.1 transcriptional regulator [Saccharibacter sp. 17.LH.SD]
MYLKSDRVLTALSIMLDVAFYAGRSGVVSGADIAKRSGLLRRGIEPVLQALSRAQLLDSVRGPKGGYRLARSPRVIILRDIALAVGGGDTLHGGEVENPLFGHVIAPFWEALNAKVESHLSEVTLSDLLVQAEKAGLRRPHQAPLSFVI